MIDFSSLVLAPAVAVFGQPLAVTPTASLPSAAPYPAAGVYARKPVDVPIEGSDLFQRTFQHEIGIRLSDYPAPPKQGDVFALPAGVVEGPGTLPAGNWQVYDAIPDGQGGATLVIRLVS